ARVAHEPLVRLDRHRALDRVLALQQRARDARRIPALAQLAVELVDEVAPVGEDQDPARARSLHEPERRDGLARAGGVLEPEALGRVWILRLLRQRLLFALVLDPVPGLLRGVPLGLEPLRSIGLVGAVLPLLAEQLIGELVVVFIVIVVFIVLVGGGALNRAELVVVLVVVV